MNETLNLFATKSAVELHSAKSPAPATQADKRASQDDQDFQKVMDRVSSEREQSESPKPQVKKEEDGDRESANGLAAGKQETTAREDGSSRSASLSPSDSEVVQEAAVSEQAQVILSQVMEQLLKNSGGEVPFQLNPDAAGQAVATNVVEATPVLNLPQAVEAAPEFVLPQVSQAPVAQDLASQDPSLQGFDLSELEGVTDPNLSESSEELKQLIQDIVPQVQPKKAPKVEQPSAQLPVAAEQSAKKEDLSLLDSEKLSPEVLSQAPKQEKALPDVVVNKGKNLGSQFQTAQDVQDPTANVKSAKSDKNSLFDELIRNQISNQSKSDEGVSMLPEAKVEKAAHPDVVFSDAQVDKTPVTQNIAKPQPLDSAANPRVLPGSLEDQVLRQIKVKLAPGLSQVQITLYPPELGSLRIRFDLEGDQMKARIDAQQGVTGAMLERHLPELKNAMSEAGIQVKEFEIHTGQQADAFAFSQPNESEEKRHQAFQNANSKKHDEFGFGEEEVGVGAVQYASARASGGIDYFV